MEPGLPGQSDLLLKVTVDDMKLGFGEQKYPARFEGGM